MSAPDADRDRSEPTRDLRDPASKPPHCEGHGGPGRWYCCQHPDAGWPCPETVEDDELRLARQWLTKGARDADELAMFLSQSGIED